MHTVKTIALIHSQFKVFNYFGHHIPRAARVPVEFEAVKLDKSHNSEEDFRKALLSIKRNGVALKGQAIILLFYSVPHQCEIQSAFTAYTECALLFSFFV